MDMTKVILVDENDNPIGEAEKMQAHIDGLLHRAFSVFIFNTKGEMLLQQRAMSKYHSGGLWTNACCSHPFPGEKTEAAAIRRLQEEMGFAVPVKKIFDFIYKTSFDNGLTEHEFDHVFAGIYDNDINCNPEEVMNFSYRTMNEISQSLQLKPREYTAWFHLAFPKIAGWYNRQAKDKTIFS
jgi:isopentenyl-diphosphate Delta-isomerase